MVFAVEDDGDVDDNDEREAEALFYRFAGDSASSGVVVVDDDDDDDDPRLPLLRLLPLEPEALSGELPFATLATGTGFGEGGTPKARSGTEPGVLDRDTEGRPAGIEACDCPVPPFGVLEGLLMARACEGVGEG